MVKDLVDRFNGLSPSERRDAYREISGLVTLGPEDQTESGRIIQPENFWTIENVVDPRTGETRNRFLLKEMLPLMNYAQMTAHYIRAIANREFHAEDAPTTFAIMEAVKNSNYLYKEQIREFLQKSMREGLPSMLSQGVYDIEEKVVHKEGIKGKEYERKGQIYGPDRELSLDDDDLCEALFLVKSAEKVKDVLNWINETPVGVWRKNEKSFSKDKRVAGFVAGSLRVCFDLNRGPAGLYSSFGYK